jgi:hypothetical protein
MMLQARSLLPDPATLVAHARLVLDGRVSPVLLWEKHGFALVAAVLFGVMLLMMLKRLLFGARPRIIVQQVAEREGRR